MHTCEPEFLIDALPADMALAAVRHRLNRECPFLGLIVTRVPIVFDSRAKTALCTNEGEFGAKVYLAPGFAARLTLPELTAVVLHEILHPVFGWFDRRGSRDKDDWNKAHDYAINEVIDDFMHSPGVSQGSLVNLIAWPTSFPCLLDRERFGGMPGEQIYKILQLEPRPLPNKNPQAGQPGAEHSGDGPKDGFGPRNQGNGIDDQTDCLEVVPEASSRGQNAAMERLIVSAAAHHHRMKAGCLPGAMEAHIRAIQFPPVNWVDAVLAMAEGSLRGDRRTYARLSRRGLSAGVLLPGRSAKRPRLGIALDTSISNRPNLEAFFGVIRQVAEIHESEVRLIQVDAAIQEDQVIEDFDTLALDGLVVHGLGGTNFGPILEALETSEPLDLLILLTDGNPKSWPARDDWPCEVFVIYTQAAPPPEYASAQIHPAKFAA